MRENPRPQELYQHFKGNMYQIMGIAKDSENGEEMVVYQALYGDYAWYVRPLSMFMSEVDVEKYPECTQKYRFEKVEKNPLGTMRNEREDVFVSTEQQDQSADAVQKMEAAVQEEVMEIAAIGKPLPTEEKKPTEGGLDPLVLEFLDADSYEEKLNILAALHHRITNEMITTMAIASDIEIGEMELEDRYQELRYCLTTKDRFEIKRY